MISVQIPDPNKNKSKPLLLSYYKHEKLKNKKNGDSGRRPWFVGWIR